MVGAIHHHAWADTSLVSYCFRASSVPIMTGIKKKDSKLNFNWGLRVVRVVVEDSMGVDHIDDVVKGVRVNADSSSILINVSSAPMVKEGEL
jgi:hypothetical protein